MQELIAPPAQTDSRAPNGTPEDGEKEKDVVSTHVLVAEDHVEKLRVLSRRTRIAQSEYLREAVDDLLTKYNKATGEH